MNEKKKKKDQRVMCKRDLEFHAGHIPTKSGKNLRNALVIKL